MAMQGFDRARPLWEFTAIEGLDGDRSALITKVHHAITDGVGGVKLMMAVLDLEIDAEDDEVHLPPAPDAVVTNEPQRVVDALAYEGRRQVGNATKALSAPSCTRSAGCATTRSAPASRCSAPPVRWPGWSPPPVSRSARSWSTAP